MNRLLFILVMLLPGTLLMGQKLNANLDYARFYSPELGPYLETYLSVDMDGLQFIEKEEGSFQAQVNFLLIFKRNDSIVDYSKTLLSSPMIQDTTDLNFSFIDQQRFFLPNGNYEVEIEFQDANVDAKPNKAIANIQLDFTTDEIQMSDFQLIDSYQKSGEWKSNTKNGLDMVPHVRHFYGNNEKTLTYYVEIYNALSSIGNDQKFLMTAYIAPSNATEVASDLIVRKRLDAQEVNVILSQFDLSKLISGNYNLVIELRNKTNEVLIARKSFFQVSNDNVLFNQDILDQLADGKTFVNRFDNDSLTVLIESVFPIAGPNERSFIKNSLKTATEEQKRNFLYYFWYQVDPTSPENAWKTYQIEVVKTNNSFGNKYTPGYATDMGRVYLQYGPPNTIADQEYESGGFNHVGNVPYQIWHYYEIANQRDGKFVFYNPHLIPNGYTLLHSNVIGEVSNPHWQTYLKRDQLENIDAPSNDRYDGKSGELYNNPR